MNGASRRRERHGTLGSCDFSMLHECFSLLLSLLFIPSLSLALALSGSLARSRSLSLSLSISLSLYLSISLSLSLSLALSLSRSLALSLSRSPPHSCSLLLLLSILLLLPGLRGRKGAPTARMQACPCDAEKLSVILQYPGNSLSLSLLRTRLLCALALTVPPHLLPTATYFGGILSAVQPTEASRCRPHTNTLQQLLQSVIDPETPNPKEYKKGGILTISTFF